jgi:hypothetical protein
MITFYSFIPSLKNNIGHFFEYNQSLSECIKNNGWKHIKIVSKNAEISLPDGDWEKKLYPFHKYQLINIRNVFPIFKILKKLKKIKNGVIFLEDFNLLFQCLIFISIFFIRPKISIWFFYRYEHLRMLKKGKFNKFIHKQIEKILGKGNVKYLTDSTLIAKKNRDYFKRHFYILPIPHTRTFLNSNINKKNKHIHYYFPGGSIRKEKGIDYIIYLANLLSQKRSLAKLILAKSTEELIPQKKNVIFVENNLKRKTYENLLRRSSLILLPYLPEFYSYRTSGIFVETICLANIPVTSKNTWMAYELKKYDLDELAIDWNNGDLDSILFEILNDLNIKKKIAKMQLHYNTFHNVTNFASQLNYIIK